MLRRGAIPLLVLLMLVAGLAAEPALAALEPEPDAEAVEKFQLVSGVPRFEFRVEDDSPYLVLGANMFTPQQLLQFVAALPDFLEGAARLEPGQTLALRQSGAQGYLTLSAAHDEPMNRFTLTLMAEPPADVANVAAVQGLGLELLSMLLTQE